MNPCSRSPSAPKALVRVLKTVLVILGAWFAVSIVTAAIWSAFARTLAGTRRALTAAQRRRRRAAISQAALLVASVAVAMRVGRDEQWEPASLVIVLAALALATDAAPLRLGRYRFSADFLAIVLAIALLGPQPAVAIGLACVLADAVRTRPRPLYLLNNLAAYAVFPLLGSLALQPVQDQGPVVLGAACFAVALAVNLVNFLIIAGHAKIVDGDPLLAAVRRTWLPVLPWEIATAAFTGVTVWGFFHLGPIVVAGLALALAVLHLMAARLAAGARRRPTARPAALR